MSDQTNGSDFLKGAALPPAISWKDRPAGFQVTGTIVDIVERQQTDIKTNQPQVWPDGKPRMQHVFTLATEYRRPDVEHDDGQRTLWVAGSRKPESKSLAAAIIGAAQALGLTEQAQMIGCKLTVTFDGKGTSTSPGLDPPNTFSAVMERGVPVAPQPDANSLI